MKNQDIHGAIMAIMEGLKREGKSLKTLKTYETSLNSFGRYITENKVEVVNESFCLEYIHLKTGQRFSSFACVTSSSRVDYRMRPLSLLLFTWKMGNFVTKSEIQSQGLSARSLCDRIRSILRRTGPLRIQKSYY